MASFNEALSIGLGATYPIPRPTDDGKVARLDQFVGRRGVDHRHRADTAPFDLHRLGEEFDELTIRFEPDQGALWCLVNHSERPCFTPRLLHQIRTLQTRLKNGLAPASASDAMPVRAVVWGSTFPGIWNLGGDLELFTRLIRAHAAKELRSYAYACIDAVYQNLTKMGLPLLTIGLVQGDALGGGFEHALTNDVIIAERDSKLGLPEVLFNLFPGMGAYSLLCRRLDGVRAQQLILSGRVYEAQELEELGLVDLVVAQGEGPAAVREYLERNRRRHGTLLALSRVRQRCQPVSYEELIDVTDIWVETALGLDEADLRRMEHLVRAQSRRHARTQPPRRAALVAVG
ncbi:MAG TPA: crotonase/enoyl-CoA hydratase family protein [Geminicoccaceae bacterium]|jgi:DSF synthase|nr:crotonase/enoyl-CoA hydratase family protein [Geminicoccaceae bacterium]